MYLFQEALRCLAVLLNLQDLRETTHKNLDRPERSRGLTLEQRLKWRGPHSDYILKMLLVRGLPQSTAGGEKGGSNLPSGFPLSQRLSFSQPILENNFQGECHWHVENGEC